MDELEQSLRVALRTHAEDAPDPHRTMTALTRAEAPRRRRGRQAVVATAAVVAAGTTVAVGLHHGPDRSAPVPTDGPSAASSARSPALVTLSRKELTRRLADALPGPSAAHSGGSQKEAVTAVRVYETGEVSITVSALPFGQSDVQKMCDEESGAAGRGEHCTTTAAGWVTTLENSHPDAAGADAHVRMNTVWYYGRDGAVVHVSASNVTGRIDHAPVAPFPVMTTDQLVALATGVDWYR